MYPDLSYLESVKSDLPSLGIREKSRGSVRESGDSVERLEGCSGARDARSGLHGRRARGQARGGARGCVSGQAAVRAGVRLDARASGSVRLLVHCSPESTIFTRNEEINLK
ncbi:hypothetical protein CRG98_029074 [Punica granatum]|uniref:Uncharacterized protein n=1 Tax=Punica granatum TaxID=22663 RepID=A0A2I0J3K8_PUNGR|nr:hypothetical protein CRG98_029074 [Punica granatum]